MAQPPKKKPEDDIETTGHVWDDDLQEYNNPLPRWWLWTFYATIVWGVIYTILYPAWPLVNQATAGVLGWSSRALVAEDIARMEERNAALTEELASIELTAISDNPDLYNYAVSGGAAVFRTYCSQCHGQGAAGVQASGYPNLLDDDWLWGGTIEDIHYTVTHGIRNEDFDSRYSQMPAYGEIFTAEEIDQVVNHVLQISGQEHDAAAAEAGSELFLDNCAACHMDDGSGDPFQGAPNLTDAIWLYGGDYDTLVETVTYSRFGVMPHWKDRLTEAQIRSVATYVHQLGGGE